MPSECTLCGRALTVAAGEPGVCSDCAAEIRQMRTRQLAAMHMSRAAFMYDGYNSAWYKRYAAVRRNRPEREQPSSSGTGGR